MCPIYRGTHKILLYRDKQAMPLTDQEISQLVGDWTRKLVLFAHQWTDSADDVVQEVFLKLYRLQTPPGDVVAWLFVAVRNAALNVRRSEMLRARREHSIAEATTNWFEPNLEDQLNVKELLLKLPPALREIVVARIWGELTFEQIADVMETSPATAFRRYNEAIDILRNLMKD